MNICTGHAPLGVYFRYLMNSELDSYDKFLLFMFCASLFHVLSNERSALRRRRWLPSPAKDSQPLTTTCSEPTSVRRGAKIRITVSEDLVSNEIIRTQFREFLSSLPRRVEERRRHGSRVFTGRRKLKFSLLARNNLSLQVAPPRRKHCPGFGVGRAWGLDACAGPADSSRLSHVRVVAFGPFVSERGLKRFEASERRTNTQNPFQLQESRHR